MDLFNNALGRSVGISDSDDLPQAIMDKLNNDELRYISNQDSDCRATHQSVLIKTNE
ncbi:hypothetical protein [uncultured Croceitalea sp.]|uniref:hypothetical protein n=1 Tax=uncultured Croceitalea sp. TaxID=1798908 RepID=UPI00374F8F49